MLWRKQKSKLINEEAIVVKNRLLSGISIGVLGLLILLIPVCIFPTCSKVMEIVGGGTEPMKCFWSGRAEIGIGLLILCGGVLMTFLKSAPVRLGISMMTALAGILGILVPSVLIGGCEMNMMTCRMTTFPAVTVISGLAVAAAAANILYLWAQNKKTVGIGL